MRNPFFQLLSKIHSHNESKGKFDVYFKTKRFYRKKKYITQIQNNKLRRHITRIRCPTNILPINILRKYNIKRQYRFCILCKVMK